VSQPVTGSDDPGSIVHDGAVTLDLRHVPTRDELGVPAGHNDRAYQRAAGAPPLSVQVLLPHGTLRTSAFLVTASGDDYTPAGTAHERPPERIQVQRVFGSAAEAADSLTADAALLGLDRAGLELLLTRVDQGRPPALPQHGTVTGFVRDWLSVTVDVIGHEDPSVQVNYVFAIHRYHSPAIDKVVHGGVFGLDLTRRPTREDLAMRDGYSRAELLPEPDSTLVARVRLPGGELSRPVSSATSASTGVGTDDPTGSGPPRYTQLVLEAMGAADAERTLRADAPLLGLDPRAVDVIFAGRAGSFVQRELVGDSTPVYAVTAKVEVTLGQPGRYAASIRYTFSYR
jgi:hypothetical protein